MSRHSSEAEYAVIGSILQDNNLIDDVSSIVSPQDFFLPFCREVYQASINLAANSKAIDFVTLGNEMSLDRESLKELVDIMENTVVRNVVTYAKVIKDKALERQMEHIGFEIQQLSKSGLPTEEKIDKAQSMLVDLEATKDTDYDSPMQILKRVLDDMEYRANREGEIVGLATGFDTLDQRYLGWQEGDLIVIAGRPSMGKSAFASAIVLNNLLLGKSCFFASLEMGREQVMQRMLACLSGIHIKDVISGKAVTEPHQCELLVAAIEKLKSAKLAVDDNSSMTVNQLKSRARRIWKKQGLDLIVVDYLQLMSGDGQSREQEIAGISRELKKLGRELKIPVVALSQLNRGLESRADKRPLMSDLRESGAIEQDADVVCFVYRDEVYNENTLEKGITQVITRKFRNGEIGTDYLQSDLARMKYGETHYSPDADMHYGDEPPKRKKKTAFSY